MKNKILIFLLFVLLLITPGSVQAGNTWTLVTVDSTGDVGEYSSLRIGNDGYPRISYYDSTNGDLKYIRCTDETCSTKTVTTVDSTGNVGQYTSLVLGRDGFGRISYYDSTNEDLKFVQCTNDDCSTNVVSILDTGGTVGWYTSLELGADGFGRISYYDSTNTALKFAQCTNESCSTNVLTTVDSTGNVGAGTAIALGRDGFVRIAYRDVTNQDLKFAQCTNNSCSTNVLTTVDSVGNVSGLSNSLVVADDGYGRISYQDITNGDLKYVQCTNDSCSTKNITVIDSDGNVGALTSIVLNAQGLVRISYRDQTNADLKLAIEIAEAIPTPSSSAPSAPSCDNSSPTNSPDLFQINTTKTNATLFYTPVSNSNNYFIMYGFNPGDNRFGVQTNQGISTGVLSYVINDLSPNTTYYFQIRGQNGCMPGNWGNILTGTTNTKINYRYESVINSIY